MHCILCSCYIPCVTYDSITLCLCTLCLCDIGYVIWPIKIRLKVKSLNDGRRNKWFYLNFDWASKRNNLFDKWYRKSNLICHVVKWGAYPRLYSSLYCSTRISDQMTIEKMHSTFTKWSSSGSKSNRLGFFISWFSHSWTRRSLYRFFNENHIHCIAFTV